MKGTEAADHPFARKREQCRAVRETLTVGVRGGDKTRQPLFGFRQYPLQCRRRQVRGLLALVLDVKSRRRKFSRLSELKSGF